MSLGKTHSGAGRLGCGQCRLGDVGQTWVEWHPARRGWGLEEPGPQGLGELGVWLQDKDLGLPAIVCIRGPPSVCTSQVCLQVRSWPAAKTHFCLSQPLSGLQAVCLGSRSIIVKSHLTGGLGAESFPWLSL